MVDPSVDVLVNAMLYWNPPAIGVELKVADAFSDAVALPANVAARSVVAAHNIFSIQVIHILRL